MSKTHTQSWSTRLARARVSALLLATDRRGQDLMEYALMAGLVAVVVYGFLPTEYAPALSTVWMRVRSVMSSIGGA